MAGFGGCVNCTCGTIEWRHCQRAWGGWELRTLDLRNNVLAELPETLGELENLTHLDLRANRFREAPEFLQRLPKLEKIDLRWNKLRRVPDWLTRLEGRGCAVLL